MFLSQLNIQNFKGFKELKLPLREGLNVLIGENAVGKSGIIDALRLLLLEDEYGRSGIIESHFHKPFAKDAKASESFQIQAGFAGLNEEERVAFLPWTEGSDTASLTLHADNKENRRGKYKRVLWGGASRNSIFEWELLDTINCIYLPALRDAEAKLREGKGSRLARLLKNLNRQALKEASESGTPHELEKKVNSFNNELTQEGAIAHAQGLIKARLKEALGTVFGQDALIQFSETGFNRIVESLRILFFPELDSNLGQEVFRDLGQNSLGYNNLIYMATVLAELTSEEGKKDNLRILLIEEPEAHLHPQLQIQFLKFLERKAQEAGIQVIVTTHSPVLASSASLDTIIHLAIVDDNDTSRNVKATPLTDCGLSPDSNDFVSRWLDITKSTLLFAKGVIMVEGIAEALLLPELAKRVLADYKTTNTGSKLPTTLTECGVSTINLNGIYFKHFMQLFCNLQIEEDLSQSGGTSSTDDSQNQSAQPSQKTSEAEKFDSIPIRCAGVTDNDPEKKEKPTKDKPADGNNHALKLIDKINKSPNCRLYTNLKTFEYDLAMEGGNLDVMIPVFLSMLDTDGGIRDTFNTHNSKNWSSLKVTDDEKKEVAYELLDRIGKGEFAQKLAIKLSDPSTSFSVPEYIKNAVLWAVGVNNVTT